jgi:thiamine-phosphate pyrophosphorylase
LQPDPKPILCYVTDRRALDLGRVPSAGESSAKNISIVAARALLEKIRNAAAAGIDWVQIREKNLETRPLADLARLAVATSRGTRTKILVNDRLDVALATGAAGVHLGETSLPVETVAEWRRSAGRAEFLIGASCHSFETARKAESAGADYIFFGPVFATPSKAAFGAPQGIERLREVCRSARIPVLAIGGITVENAHSCFDVGAAGVAAIRVFQESDDMSDLVNGLRK